MEFGLTTLLSNIKDSANHPSFTMQARFFLFNFAHINFGTPFLAFHDTTVSPTHRVMEPLRSRKCEDCAV
jgi:hypothetical protein